MEGVRDSAVVLFIRDFLDNDRLDLKGQSPQDIVLERVDLEETEGHIEQRLDKRIEKRQDFQVTQNPAVVEHKSVELKERPHVGLQISLAIFQPVSKSKAQVLEQNKRNPWHSSLIGD